QQCNGGHGEKQEPQAKLQSPPSWIFCRHYRLWRDFALGGCLLSPAKRPGGAVLRHARIIASFTIDCFAARSVTIVAPRSPHAPAAGLKAFGAACMNDCCCSGVSLTMPQTSSGPSVAKIFPPIRKSG